MFSDSGPVKTRLLELTLQQRLGAACRPPPVFEFPKLFLNGFERRTIFLGFAEEDLSKEHISVGRT